MKLSVKIKILVDICMTAALLACMSYLLIGEKAHEWIGSGMFVLFILHHILNWKWYKNLFNGKYSFLRILQTAVNFLTFICMIGLMVSGIILSRYVFDFMRIRGMTSYARTLHMLSSYWGFVLMSLHLGLHWGMLLGMIKKMVGKNRLPDILRWCLRGAALLIACYGLTAFIKHDLLSYMLLKKRFVFFDMEQPLFLFFLDYTAIMGFWIWIIYYIREFFIKISRQKGVKK
jgi:hypothetical protein